MTRNKNQSGHGGPSETTRFPSDVSTVQPRGSFCWSPHGVTTILLETTGTTDPAQTQIASRDMDRHPVQGACLWLEGGDA